MEFGTNPLARDEIETLNVEASALMKQGIALLERNQPADATEALAFFDRALAMRRRLPFESEPILRYGLAACWINRADALVRQGSRALPDALRSYDEGIALLRAVVPCSDAQFPRRLAMAYHNRGLAFRVPGVSGTEAAIASFEEAISVLDLDCSSSIPDRRYLLAVVRLNLAGAQASRATIESAALARDGALRAISLIKGLEDDDAAVAEVGLGARHLLCQTLAYRLSQPALTGESMPAEVHEATDLVDDGLAIIRRWEKKGMPRFRRIACDLFRFGARVYARYQPHFLNEFVIENINPSQSSEAFVESEEMQIAVGEAIDFIRNEGSQSKG